MQICGPHIDQALSVCISGDLLCKQFISFTAHAVKALTSDWILIDASPWRKEAQEQV